jgi:hypothetical protein
VKYPYFCAACNISIDIEKPMSLSDRSEHCGSCGSSLSRKFTPSYIIGASVEDSYYSHALGKVVHSRRSERQEAARNGLEEVGSESQSKHIKAPESKYPTVDELYKAGAFS